VIETAAELAEDSKDLVWVMVVLVTKRLPSPRIMKRRWNGNPGVDRLGEQTALNSGLPDVGRTLMLIVCRAEASR